MLMAVDSVDCVTKTMPCFWELLVALMQLLLFVDIVDVVLRGNRLRDSVPEILLAKAFVDRCWLVLMAVDVVTKTKPCFCELVAPLLQMLLSVDLVDTSC